jgi:hypothetical protein
MLQQICHRYVPQCGLVRAFQHYLGRDTGFECFFPAQRTQAPPVAGVQTRKTVLRPWGDEVIASFSGKRQKCCRHNSAYHMPPRITGAGGTTTVAVKPCEWIKAARAQGLSEYIEG